MLEINPKASPKKKARPPSIVSWKYPKGDTSNGELGGRLLDWMQNCTLFTFLQGWGSKPLTKIYNLCHLHGSGRSGPQGQFRLPLARQLLLKGRASRASSSLQVSMPPGPRLVRGRARQGLQVPDAGARQRCSGNVWARLRPAKRNHVCWFKQMTETFGNDIRGQRNPHRLPL